MLSLSRMRFLLLVSAVFIGLITAGTSQGQGVKGKTYTFNSYDGVELSGTLYANGGGKRDAVVLLIPHFDLRKGGGIQQDGWSSLAQALHADGYSVFSFDFRGFGDSKTVNPATFWNFKHNLTMVRARKKLATQIDHKEFTSAYVPYLVNDIAAAKAFLDRENDRKTVNTSNLIVIGAGNGAALGAMWMAGECRRRKDTRPLPVGPPMLGDPESKGIAVAAWLSITPSVGSVKVGRWITEAGKTNKIPMAFVYGKNDVTAGNIAIALTKAIQPKKMERAHAIPETKLSGHNLLQRSLETQDWLLTKCLDPVMTDRRAKQQVVRDVAKSRYYYTNANGVILKPNKNAGDDVPPVDVNFLLTLTR